jgi:hypothetical protein
MRAWIPGLIVVLALASPTFGQLERSVMEGTVTDPQGAFIPGVKVVVIATETNVTMPTVTNSAGYYRVTSLVPGKYQVHFEAPGLSPLDMKDIIVPAGQTIRADAQLRLGATRQTVEVSATAMQVQTGATDFSTTLGASAIQQIPLGGRDLQQLVLLVPGVIGNGPPGTSFGFNSQFGSFPDPTHMTGSDVSVNGGQTGTNAWYLDGNFNLASGMAESVVVNPTPDAVSEFNVVTSGFSAEYGRSGGAVFSVVLKSGTNQLHGNIYEYGRNSVFNARNPFTSIASDGTIIPQNQMRFNNFGGTLGGPVVIPHLYNGRNKTFFFFSMDETILHVSGSQRFTVPTAKMRSGDFSEDVNASTYGIWNGYSSIGPATDGTFARSALGTPVAGSPIGCTGAIVGTTAENPTSADCTFATQIPDNLMSKTAAFFTKSFPNPNYLDPLSDCPLASGGATRLCNNYLAGIGSSQDGANISLKVDHQWSDKNRFFGEWLYNPGDYNNYKLPWTGVTFPDGQFGYGGQKPFSFMNEIIALGNTYTVNPTLINEFRASFTRQYYTTHPAEGGYPDSVTDLTAMKAVLDPIQIPAQTTPSFNVNIPGGGSASWGPIGWTNNMNAHESYTILDNVTKVLAKHTLRTGFVYRLSHSAMFQSAPTPLTFTGFDDPSTPGNPIGGSGLAQFEMGAVQSNGNAYADVSWVPYLRYRYWGAYVQDDYRITPNLTLNIGLRYDIFGSYKTRQHPDVRACLTCTDPLTGLPGFVQYEGDPGFPMNSDIRPPNFNDFGPRINFSWTPFSDRKTVIRGGYDLYFSNAYSAINSSQAVENSSGYTYRAEWLGNAASPGCAIYSGQCAAWSLDNTDPKGPLAIPPPSSTGSPAQHHAPLYLESMNSMEKPTRDPSVQMWTLQVQRELPGNMLVTVGYVGSHGTHLVGDTWSNDTNLHTADKLKYKTALGAVVPITDYFSGQAAAGLAQIYGATSLSRSQLLTSFPQYSWIGGTAKFNANSIYHALQIRLQKRYSYGLNFDVAYTWSKSIQSADAGSLDATVIDPIHFGRTGYVGGRTGSLGNANMGFSYQAWDNIKEDRTLAFNDIPQILNFSTSYELPFGVSRKFVNRKGPINLLIGGWNLTGNFHAEKGVPLGISGPCDQLTCRPDLIGNPSAVPGGQNQNQWINGLAFTPPWGSSTVAPDASADNSWLFGTAGLRLPGLRSPGYWNLDTSLTKKFNVTESKYFEFRWEAFNALNHQNLGMPNTGFCLPPNADGSVDAVHQAGCSFGRITNVQTDPRTLAFALKFYW